MLLTSLFATYAVANAQGLAVKVQPSTVEQQLDPGAVAEGDLTITNQSDTEEVYKIETRNIVGMNDAGRPEFSDIPSSDEMEAAAWILPTVKEATVPAGKSVTIPYRIMVPAQASPGSYFAAVWVTREAETTEESGAGVGFHVASLFNIRISGDAQEGLLIREFFTDKVLYGGATVAFTTRVENTGTVHQRPRGIISITDMLGNDVDQLAVNEQAGGVMPRQERIFEGVWSTDEFTLGKYRALLSMAYGEQVSQTITREVTFWVLPGKEIGIVLGVIAGVVLLLMFAVRAYVRRALRRAGVSSAERVKARTQSLTRKMLKTVGMILVVVAVLFIGMIVFFG